jgi:hypothetical protein
VRIQACPRAHQLEGAPHVVFKRQQGQLVEGSHRGRASTPSVPSERDRPYLVNPRKRFHGRVSRPRANPYRTGHGHPLQSSDNSSARNSQFATRSMGVVETSPSVPRRDDEATYKQVGEHRSPRTGPGSGARRTATPPRNAPNADVCQTRAHGTAEAGWDIADAG